MVITNYTTATKTEITNEMIEEHRKKKLAEKENLKKDSFFTAREQAFNNLQDKHTAEKLALAKIWQNKENAGYVI